MVVLHKISIIVPVYNIETYVAKCIKSILNQTYQNLEIIIVNDGSTDKSGKICEYYSQQDRRITLINQTNQGLSMARNNAIQISTGEYIGFVDGDDWIEHDMYDLLYKNIIQHDADISICGFTLENNNDYSCAEIQQERSPIIILEGYEKMANHISTNINCVWDKLYKHSLFNDIKFPKGKLFEDVFVTYKLIDRANRIVQSPEKKYHYVDRKSSITRECFSIKKLDAIEGLSEKYFYISKKYPELDHACKAILLKHLIAGVNNAYFNGYIQTNKSDLISIISTLDGVDIESCGLSKSEIKILKLIFTNLDSYCALLKRSEGIKWKIK